MGQEVLADGGPGGRHRVVEGLDRVGARGEQGRLEGVAVHGRLAQRHVDQGFEPFLALSGQWFLPGRAQACHLDLAHDPDQDLDSGE
jgi:hypothetical protein